MEERIAVVGLGYVGLPLALLAARKGYAVSGIDIQESKIEKLSRGVSPFADERTKRELADAVRSGSVSFSSEFSPISKASIVVICVPTPVHHDHTPDLGPVESAARGIGACLKRGTLIVLESTVNPGVSEEFVLPILEEESGLVGGEDFYLAHCPERINPGDPTWHVENVPRVLGSLEYRGLEIAHKFYSSVLTGKVVRMQSLREAEAVKVVENSFRDINIAFVNELAMSFSRLGIDVVNVINGAATKPFGFMPHYPSCGVGGHCIPIDPYYLIDYAEKNGFYHEFLSLARRINNHMPEFTVAELHKALSEKKLVVNGAQVAVLGLAYKPNIDDCRESPAFEIMKHLEHEGAAVRTFDPHVLERSTAKTLDEALDGATAAIIATAHDEFKKLSVATFSKKGVKAVVDGANCLAKEQFEESGVAYRGIGRQTERVQAETAQRIRMIGSAHRV